MLALLPKDLTDDDQLRIYKTYHRKKGQDILGPTKNSKKGGNRNVPIPHWLAEEFRTYCSKLYGLTQDDRVFYMTCTALNKELTRCTQITYLPDIRVHDLRHPYVKPTTKKFLSFFKFEMAISLRAFLCFALLLDIKEGPQFVPFIR